VVDNLGGGFIRNQFGEVLEGGRLKTSLRIFFWIFFFFTFYFYSVFIT